MFSLVFTAFRVQSSYFSVTRKIKHVLSAAHRRHELSEVTASPQFPLRASSSLTSQRPEPDSERRLRKRHTSFITWWNDHEHVCDDERSASTQLFTCGRSQRHHLNLHTPTPTPASASAPAWSPSQDTTDPHLSGGGNKSQHVFLFIPEKQKSQKNEIKGRKMK